MTYSSAYAPLGEGGDFDLHEGCDTRDFDEALLHGPANSGSAKICAMILA